MSATLMFVLVVLIYRPDDDRAWEQGTIAARSCAEAERYVRAGLRPGQAVVLGECRPLTAEVAEGGR